MTKTIKITALALLLSLASSGLNFSAANGVGNLKPEQPEAIIYDYDVDMERHQISWTPISGSTPYQVTLFNMTTGTMHTQLSTTATSVNLYGLVNANTYWFSVSRGATTDSIIIDIIDL